MRHATRLALLLAPALMSASPACAAARNTSAAVQQGTLVHDGLTRRYVVRAPDNLSRIASKVPLVVVLHGGGGNAANAERMTGFTEKARQEGFIVVYPEGTSRTGTGLLTWNAGHCCGYAMENRVRDVEFISALLDKLRYRCPSGRAVEIHVIKDNGHAWPGGESGSRFGDTPGTAFDGTSAIWAFFAAHPKSS